MMRKLSIVLVLSICTLMVSAVIATNDNPNMVVTYGETTYHNQQYLNSVNSYFAEKGYSDLGSISKEIISASQVNNVSKNISGKVYDSKQIFSSAIVDLTHGDTLKVTVDSSKINLVTAKMYASVLESLGINKGKVFVTSPVSATGESALAGIMACYEKATNVQIPDDVKQAANEEIYIEAEVANNTNVSGDNISQIVEEVKNQALTNNINSHDGILDLVNQTIQKYNFPIFDEDMEKLTDAIFNIVSLQDQINQYQSALEKSL